MVATPCSINHMGLGYIRSPTNRNIQMSGWCSETKPKILTYIPKWHSWVLLEICQLCGQL